MTLAEPAVRVWEPACFDTEELASWRAGETAACAACEPDWHDRATVSGRCNGIPGFLAQISEEEDDVEHHLNGAAATAEIYAARREAKALTVEIGAPCGTCTHAPVCRLRDSLARLTAIQANIPKLDDVVAVTLKASVTCGHYERAKKTQSEAQRESSRRAAAMARAAKAAKRLAQAG